MKDNIIWDEVKGVNDESWKFLADWLEKHPEMGENVLRGEVHKNGLIGIDYGFTNPKE